MTSQPLLGCRVFLVEDDFLIADDFSRRLSAAGADVIGPVASLDGAFARYKTTDQIHFAILDVNLRGTSVLPLAIHLQEEGVPFAFCTGYGEETIGEKFSSTPRFEKPLSQYGFATMIDLILIYYRLDVTAPHPPLYSPM